MGCHNLSAVLGAYPDNMTMLYLIVQPGVTFPQCTLHNFNGNHNQKSDRELVLYPIDSFHFRFSRNVLRCLSLSCGSPRFSQCLGLSPDPWHVFIPQILLTFPTLCPSLCIDCDSLIHFLPRGRRRLWGDPSAVFSPGCSILWGCRSRSRARACARSRPGLG